MQHPTHRVDRRSLFVFLTLVALAGALSLAAHDDEIPLDGEDSNALGFVPCVDGWASVYACSGIDIESVLPQGILAGGSGALLNDLWGWTDPATGVEYALVGLENGTAFVDLRNTHAPRVVGRLPTRSFAAPWRDIKTYGNHAFIVADTPSHGLQVFDLTRLRGGSADTVFTPDATYSGPGFGANAGFSLGNAHNLSIDVESGFAFIVGSRGTCSGGLHMVDIRDPVRPRFAGCFGETGYTHDTQCLTYRGPDGDHTGRQLCFNSDPEPSSLSIVDVTDKTAPRLISRTSYPGAVYAHQGWLSENQRWFFLGDELDEGRTTQTTRTIIFDVVDLDAPRVVGSHTSDSRAIGHNMYTRGGRLYQANYTDGLTIYGLGSVAQGRLDEVGWFDIVPGSDERIYSGAWSVYPYFPSGTVIVSGISNGLFVLRPAFLGGHDHSGGDGYGGHDHDGHDHGDHDHGDHGQGSPSGGESTGSPSGAALAPPAALTAVASPGAVAVGWEDGGGTVAYRLVRRIGDQPWTWIGELPASARSYVDQSVAPGQRLTYRVSSVGSDGSMARSFVEVVVPASGPPASPGPSAPGPPSGPPPGPSSPGSPDSPDGF